MIAQGKRDEVRTALSGSSPPIIQALQGAALDWNFNGEAFDDLFLHFAKSPLQSFEFAV
jgi:hypothetical protein